MVFARFASGLIGHHDVVERLRISDKLDYEGEFVAVIGKRGKHISRKDALDHVVGYSLFNDVSVRDYQMRTPQWTVGKNFDSSRPFGPWLMTADELPAGCRDLRLQTRLNGAIVQDVSTDDMIFDVATLVAILSDAFTLEPGDIIVTGTPAGVGGARTPPLWMRTATSSRSSWKASERCTTSFETSSGCYRALRAGSSERARTHIALAAIAVRLGPTGQHKVCYPRSAKWNDGVTRLRLGLRDCRDAHLWPVPVQR